jgi:hypothetical protein
MEEKREIKKAGKKIQYNTIQYNTIQKTWRSLGKKLHTKKIYP